MGDAPEGRRPPLKENPGGRPPANQIKATKTTILGIVIGMGMDIGIGVGIGFSIGIVILRNASSVLSLLLDRHTTTRQTPAYKTKHIEDKNQVSERACLFEEIFI